MALILSQFLDNYCKQRRAVKVDGTTKKPGLFTKNIPLKARIAAVSR
jgi:hypothetical protein